MRFLSAFMQWLHIASAVVLIGGLFFLGVILLPALKVLPEHLRSSMVQTVFQRFRVLVWAATLTILISGVYNFITTLRTLRVDAHETAEDASMYILTLGLKLLIVFVIFTFGLLLTCPYPVFAPIQKRPTPWLNLAMVLGLIVLFLSAFLRRF